MKPDQLLSGWDPCPLNSLPDIKLTYYQIQGFALEEGDTIADHLSFSLSCQSSSLGLLTGRLAAQGEELLALQGVLFWGPRPSDPLLKGPSGRGPSARSGQRRAQVLTRECSLEAGQALRQHRGLQRDRQRRRPWPPCGSSNSGGALGPSPCAGAPQPSTFHHIQQQRLGLTAGGNVHFLSDPVDSQQDR